MINNYFYNLSRYNSCEKIYTYSKYTAFQVYLISNQTNSGLQKILKKKYFCHITLINIQKIT